MIAGLTLASGCAENFAQKMHEHPDCIGDAKIAPGKVDYCLSYSNGHRNDVNNCLAGQGVPDAKIEALNSCVDVEEHRASY